MEKTVTKEAKYDTPIRGQIIGTNYEELLSIPNIVYSADTPSLYVDINLLTQGLSSEQIAKLKGTQENPS